MRSTLAAILLGLLAALPIVGQDVQPNESRPQQLPFEILFSIRGVEFSKDQQAKREQLRQQYAPRLSELQREQRAIFTDEQRRARQAAIREARDAGKDGQEARQAADVAAKLTEEQKKQLSTIQKAQTALAAKIQGGLRALLTDQQLTQLRRGQGNRNARPRITPTHPDVKYGAHGRNIMDVWLAKSGKPTPVLVSIHGGGFRGGNKSVETGVLRECLDSGISVIAITYRLSDEAIAPAQFLDSARAIQFIRHNARKWNLDPAKVAATGGSAGAGLSLWLGFHDDLADPENEDPVLRESSRLTCMAVYNGQTSYDPRFIRDLFPGTDTYKHPALPQLYGVSFDKLDDLPDDKYRLFSEVSALPHLTKDDVPALLMYASQMDTKITNQGIGIHHPRFGEVLQEKMDPLGIECRVETGVRRGAESFTKLTMAFIKKHFASQPIVDESVTYGKAGEVELKLDLARPKGEGPFPAIIFIHGGGWFQGTRQGYRSQIEEAAKRGYVAATISYRLMKFDEAKKETTTATPIFPAQIHDAKAAVGWLRANADKYRVDPDRIGVTGGSAGGHLSLLVGLTDPESNLEGDSGHPDRSSRVQAVVNVFGPTDMADCHETSSVAWIFRLVLTLHGDEDALVPIAQANTLDKRMKAVGAAHTLIVFEGQGHGFAGEYQQKAMTAMWDFFAQHLKP